MMSDLRVPIALPRIIHALAAFIDDMMFQLKDSDWQSEEEANTV